MAKIHFPIDKCQYQRQIFALLRKIPRTIRWTLCFYMFRELIGFFETRILQITLNWQHPHKIKAIFSKKLAENYKTLPLTQII